MNAKVKSWLATSAVGTTSGGTVAFLSQFTNFSSQLDSMDKFLDAGLFMTLMGISIAAGGLLSAAADQKRNAAYSAFLNDKKLEILETSEQEANQIANGASYFLMAFFPALLGLFSCIGFDAIFESPEMIGGKAFSGLIALVDGGWGEELGEAIISGAFLGSTLFMMLIGFLSAKVAFVKREETINHA